MFWLFFCMKYEKKLTSHKSCTNCESYINFGSQKRYFFHFDVDWAYQLKKNNFNIILHRKGINCQSLELPNAIKVYKDILFQNKLVQPI